MTRLRSISRFAVVWLTLAVAAMAAVPAGWIALRYAPPTGEDEKGHWIIVKAPEDGLTAWWSDEELARIAANDPDYVKRLETGWKPSDHPVADPDEAERLTEELAAYWGGDLPQANFWAHGAMTRRGETLRAFRWEQDGLAQRTELEQAGNRPSIPAAAVDPSPLDQRYGNSTDVVSYGDRWGSHLRSGTLDHVYTSERNKAQRRHHPNPPPAIEVEQKARETVETCREASLVAELGVFENYVRGWGGLSAQNVSFGLPANCVVNPGPVTPSPPPVSVPPLIPIAPKPPTKPVTPAPKPKPPTTPVSPPPSPKPPKPAPKPPTTPVTPPPPSPKPPKPKPVTPPPPPPPPVQPPSPPPSAPVTPPAPPHNPDPGDPVIDPPPPPPPPPPEPEPEEPLFPDCKGDLHKTQAEADAVKCTYTDCKGNTHDSQAKADAVNCDPPQSVVPPPDDDPKYTACDGTLHHSQEEADAIKCRGEETDELCELDPFAPGCDQF